MGTVFHIVSFEIPDQWFHLTVYIPFFNQGLPETAHEIVSGYDPDDAKFLSEVAGTKIE
jgi:hypothetical protein